MTLTVGPVLYSYWCHETGDAELQDAAAAGAAADGDDVVMKQNQSMDWLPHDHWQSSEMWIRSTSHMILQ